MSGFTVKPPPGFLDGLSVYSPISCTRPQNTPFPCCTPSSQNFEWNSEVAGVVAKFYQHAQRDVRGAIRWLLFDARPLGDLANLGYVLFVSSFCGAICFKGVQNNYMMWQVRDHDVNSVLVRGTFFANGDGGNGMDPRSLAVSLHTALLVGIPDQVAARLALYRQNGNSNLSIYRYLTPVPLQANVPLESRATALKNFFYGHRGYAGLAPEMFRGAAYSLYYAFRIAMTTHNGNPTTTQRDLARVYDKYPMYITNADVSKSIRLFEGDPFLVAFSLLRISTMNVKSHSLLNGISWLEQPIEVDIYLPPNISALNIAWKDLIDLYIRVGHGDTKTMMKEESGDDCLVTNGDNVSQFMTLGTWLRAINIAALHLTGKQFAQSTSDLYSNPVVDALPKLLNIHLKLVLDVKCFPGAKFDITPLVQALNTHYGVSVDGIGSFYRMNAPTQSQSVSAGGLVKVYGPPKIYTFFFGPTDLVRGLNEQRIVPGAFVFVSASSLLLEDRSQQISRLDQRCYYIGDNENLNILTNLAENYNINIGVWTMEASTTMLAMQTLKKIVDSMPTVFKLGFSLGGPHNACMWPILTIPTESKCSELGTMRQFYVKDKGSAANPKALTIVSDTLGKVASVGEDMLNPLLTKVKGKMSLKQDFSKLTTNLGMECLGETNY